ncbi:MAG: peptide chain release factor N(5)-glutamine methyltransferase [Prevotellaceae bacterium]|jgi:release factor glutamine methyltransferase|nr:peptide chain release factor N(5)-glutamine methyltransferase [Prevotellaceae bacterium]
MNVLNYIREALSDNYTMSEINVIANELLRSIDGLTPAERLTHPTPFLANAQQLIKKMVERLLQGEPLQYVVGNVDFCHATILVDKRGLIPRPETAELVEWITTTETNTGEALDIGTGSGCMAVAVAMQMPHVHLSAFDVSLDALKLASENAELNQVQIDFSHVNILKTSHWDKTFDFIMSNPPYVQEKEKTSMSATVLNYEPALALFVSDDDPLLFYRHIANFAFNQLKPHGALYLEINQQFGKEVTALLKTHGFKQIELRQDLSGHDRMIRACR